MDYGTLRNKILRSDKRIGEDIKDMLTLTYYEPSTYQYSLFEVTFEYVARPDIICHKYYGNTDCVDIICKLNGISNPFELNEGDILILPSTTDLNRFIYTQDTIEAQDNSPSNPITHTPAPKAKNQKRKANEAVIGDTRFRIDKENRAVIY